jgi:hypothetical protein
VQFVRDGAPFAGGAPARDDDFEPFDGANGGTDTDPFFG